MEFESEVQAISAGFADLFAQSAAEQNVEKLRRAERTVRAATDAIELERGASRREISRSLSQHKGSSQAVLAYQGGGVAGTGQALDDAATAVAADQAAIVDANAAAKEVATVLANQPVLEDPILAAITGAQTGAEIGVSIANALLESGETHTFISPAGIFTEFTIPGFDLNDLLEGLGSGGGSGGGGSSPFG